MGDSILVRFNEAIDPTTGTLTSNYSVNLGVGNPVSVAASGDSAVWLVYAPNTLMNGTEYELSVSGVEDPSGNAILIESTLICISQRT